MSKLGTLGTPSAEVEVSQNVVYRLLKAQHPDISSLPIRLVDAGWDNAMFRLGDELAVRLPRRKVAADLIKQEQAWLPQLATRLPILVPTPCRIGKPAEHYPWHWSVVPWIEGVAADRAALDSGQAVRFADFLRSLHTPAPINAPSNPFRNVPLASRAEDLKARVQRLEAKTTLITSVIKSTFDTAILTPIDVKSTWIHGDLHPCNILIHKGEISGIIDWGDMTSGDAATDLAAVWMLFANKADRESAIAHYGNLSTATLQRAKGWAIFFAIILLDTGLIDNPRHAAIGQKILHHIAEDELS